MRAERREIVMRAMMASELRDEGEDAPLFDVVLVSVNLDNAKVIRLPYHCLKNSLGPLVEK